MLALGSAPGGFWTAGIDFDTSIAGYVLGERSVEVRGLAFERLGHELVEEKTLLGTGRKAIPFSRTAPEDARDYAAGNADAALRLSDDLRPELEATKLDRVFTEIDLPHIPVLARMEQRGLAVDREALGILGAELADEVATAEHDVYEAVGHEFQIGSPQQLSHILFEELGLPKTRKTATGWTTDANALEPLRGSHGRRRGGAEVARADQDQVDVRRHAAVAGQPAHRARTHRVLADRRGHGAALLERPEPAEHPRAHRGRQRGAQRVRRTRLRGRPAAAVVRLLADRAAHPRARLGRRGAADGVSITAPTSTARPHHACSAWRRATSTRKCGVGRRCSTSVCSTALRPSGSRSARASRRDDAEEFIRAYFEAYPSVAQWRDDVVTEARDRGYAETLTGRRRYIPELRSRNRNRRMGAERIAINMPIQGTAADIIKIAMNDIDAELIDHRKRGGLAHMVLQVHDELLFELPRAELEPVREMAERLMPSLELAVPLDLDEKSGRSWGEME